MTAEEVQYALTYSQHSPFYIRSHYVVPNVSWGLGFNHELDLLSISKEGRIGTEIEIKVSKSDLKKDLEKLHGHYDARIRLLYFAGPIELEKAFFEFAPPKAGIITISHYPERPNHKYQCVIRRRPKLGKWGTTGYKFSDKEIMQLLHLGNMRYWAQFHKQFKREQNG